MQEVRPSLCCYNLLMDLIVHTTALGSSLHTECLTADLQPLSGERMSLRSSNCDDGARLDVAATDFWTRQLAW